MVQMTPCPVRVETMRVRSPQGAFGLFFRARGGRGKGPGGCRSYVMNVGLGKTDPEGLSHSVIFGIDFLADNTRGYPEILVAACPRYPGYLGGVRSRFTGLALGTGQEGHAIKSVSCGRGK